MSRGKNAPMTNRLAGMGSLKPGMGTGKTMMHGMGKPGLGRPHQTPPGHTKFGPVKPPGGKGDVKLGMK